MAKIITFEDGSEIRILAEILTPGEMATHAYQKLMKFIEDDLVEEIDLDDLDEDIVELEEDDFEDLDDEDLDEIEDEDDDVELDELDDEWEDESIIDDEWA